MYGLSLYSYKMQTLIATTYYIGDSSAYLRSAEGAILSNNLEIIKIILSPLDIINKLLVNMIVIIFYYDSIYDIYYKPSSITFNKNYLLINIIYNIWLVCVHGKIKAKIITLCHSVL